MGTTTKEKPTLPNLPSDPYEMSSLFMNYGTKLQNILQHAAEKKQKGAGYFTIFNPWVTAESFMDAFQKIASNPKSFMDASSAFWKDYMALWQETSKSLLKKEETKPIIEPELSDRRFKDDSWRENPYYNHLMQSYLLWSRWMKDVSTDIEGVDEKTAHKVQFYSRQISDALSPSNYIGTNPLALKKAYETSGKSVLQGMNNFLRDLEAGQGQLNIKMVDRDAFQLGKNIAITPGKVVYQNDLIQLIQYEPTTKNVFRLPLLLIPPCINRFYIFDLRPSNSFVRWALDKGFTVFMVSWVNPDERLSHKSYEDYVFEGVKNAIDVMCDITGEEKVNALGYCIGGNFLATLSGYLGGEKKNPLATTSYLATLFDFENAGDLMVFIDEKQLEDIERRTKKQGYLDGDTLARTFNILRANDLIWSYVVNNYLLGEEPLAFDLLYWNSDSTNLPATMYTYYLKNMFLKNLLRKPGALTIGGKGLDLSKAAVPTFILNTRDDHIAPWWCGYAGTQVFKGPLKFVLGGSGHVAGIFNHPSSSKYGYWVNDKLSKTPNEWLKSAKQFEGSWWNEWFKWIQDYNKDMVPARKPGSKKYPPLEEAPGSFSKL